jgi:NifU-like protein involved in Fe-S cluster formation/bacterioferritin-associated ferredoxin
MSKISVIHNDVKAKVDSKNWFYSDKVKDHFFNPKNICKTQEEVEEFKKRANGIGQVGSPACGDMMEIWLEIKDNKIVDCRWRTFGCASAISSTSMLSEMLIENGGMSLEDALKIKPLDIVKRLDGLPTRKFHCSVLGDKALRAAINDYYKNSGQLDKVIVEGARIIDKILKITDKDIEEAVLEGANTFDAVQKKTKVGIQDKSCIPEVEQLIKFYQEKYFG